MTSYEGKTDEVLHIKLPSSFLHAIWLADEIAINGKAYLEVLTHWVGNKAPIKITIKDLQGKVVHIKDDEINNNLYQFLYTPSNTNNTGGVTFEVELPVHKKKTMGNLLRIGKPVEISALRFTDFNSEKTLTEIMERVPVACEAKVKGMPVEAKALISVYLRLNSAAQRGALLVEAEVPVEDGKAILYFDPNINNRIAAIKVQQELNKEYGTYLQPEYYFEVITGGVAAVSGPAKAVQNMTMHFWEMPNVAGTLEGKKVTIVYPDGKKEEKTIPKDGNIEFPKTLPGKHKVVMEEGVKVKPTEMPANTETEGDFAIDWNFIAKMEGTRNDVYVPMDSSGTVLGKSGPTIGSGFDLGQIDKAGFDKYQFSDSIQTKLSPFLGKIGNEAKNYVKNHPQKMTDEEILEINRKVHEKYAKAAEAFYNKKAPVDKKFKSLPLGAQTAFASVFFQYGKYTKTLRQNLISQDYRKAINTLLNYTTNFEMVKNIKTKNDSKLMLYLSRRCEEAGQLLLAIEDSGLKADCLDQIESKEKEWEEAYGRSKFW